MKRLMDWRELKSQMGDLAEKGELVLLELGQKAMKVVFEKINLKWNAKMNEEK